MATLVCQAGAVALSVSPSESPEFVAFRQSAGAARHLLVALTVPPSVGRGGLAAYLAAQMELELANEGALPRAAHVAAYPSQLFCDQLYRARLVGREGFSVYLKSLNALASDGVLGCEDSETVRAWLAEAHPATLRFGVSPEVLELRGYSAATSIAAWFTQQPQDEAPTLFEEGPAAAAVAVADEPAVGVVTPAPPSDVNTAEVGSRDVGSSDVIMRRGAPPKIRFESDERQIALFAERQLAFAGEGTSEPSPEVTLAQQVADWCDALRAASGVTSFAALEKLFIDAYAPLQAVLINDPQHYTSQREVLAQWAENFAECYARAFERVCGSRQRPPMVFDAPKMAFQLSRVQQASGFQLVLVDALRFDVGQRVHDKLSLQLCGHAECVAQGVLWSPLPSNTGAGLELLARGADGLRGHRPELAEAQVVSIKEARRLRKLRAGPHALFKLDAVQANLEVGKSWTSRGLDQLAAEVAVSCGRFIRRQSPDQLIFLFGDHGFRLEDSAHGGATPGEVLVPYQAWRVASAASSVAAE
jgi:hypothetical protein